jgi:hypothetical protein
VLLRNTVPVMTCESCEVENGKYFCRFCYEAYGENCVDCHSSCESEARGDDDEDDENFKPLLPVNSPRLGACGFENTRSPDGQVDFPCARPEPSADGDVEERRTDRWNLWGNEDEEDDEDDIVDERDYDRLFANKKLRR